MIKSFILYALLIGILLPMSWAASDAPAQVTSLSPKGKGIPAELRAKAEKKLNSMGITPEQYHAKLRECIDCKTKEDKKLAKTLILAGVDMVIDSKNPEGAKAFGEKVRAAMKHADVMKLWRTAVAEKMENIENIMHVQARGDLLLQYNIVEWTPTRYEEKLHAAAAAAKAYGQSIKDAENKPEGDAAHEQVKIIAIP